MPGRQGESEDHKEEFLAGRGEHDIVPVVYQEDERAGRGEHYAALVDLEEDKLAGNSKHDEVPVNHEEDVDAWLPLILTRCRAAHSAHVGLS